jgi:2-haloacid dehalogenase
MNARRYDAVLFDLLSALLDSWTLWAEVAGELRAAPVA